MRSEIKGRLKYMGQFKVVPKEIKEEIITKVKMGEKVSTVSSMYGISTKSIYRWLHEQTGEDNVSIVKYNKLKRENEELKRLIGEITLEMSVGKKNQTN